MQTTGVTAIDYRITDEILDPIGMSEDLSTEELVRLPAGALSFQAPKESPEVSELPALKNGYVTFGSFNNLCKVNGDVIAAWAEVLQAAPGSKMLIVGPEGSSVAAGLRSHGIGRERFEMLKFQAMQDYLALHHRVDLVLDTFPYNGGTVNFISAWMGVPCVTLAGRNTISRHGARVLTMVGLPELIATDAAEYVRKAADAAGDLERLGEWRKGMRARLEARASDGAAFTRELEGAYREMWRRWCGERAGVNAGAEERLCAV
jgi:predicted O-linked N-acetylglucosamine transferase (SPINDLY family)